MANSKPVKYKQLPKSDRLPDRKNPIFLLRSTQFSLLKMIVPGEINASEYAQTEMTNRGLDKKSNWVGCSGN
jgi:hypothetical protein